VAIATPFFIIAAGRSGTTLLRLILNGHSRLHIPAETWFVQPLVEALPLTGPLSRTQCKAALATMVQHERWPDMQLDAAVLQDRAEQLQSPTLRGLIDIVYAHQLAGSGKVRIGDKTPHYFFIAPQLLTVYPGAKFIHLIRDGRDVAISWIDAGWERYYERAFPWPAAMLHRRELRACWPESLLEVRYEALVRHPEAVAAEVCAFLGEAFEPGMLTWQNRIGDVAARDRHLHARLARPLSDDAVAVWRRRLSTWECFAVEACLHHDLRDAGYTPRFGARLWRPLLGLTAWTLRALAPLLRRLVPWLQRRGVLPDRTYI
jgi:hypothetical protein